jgi:sugar/nucleoside kinase (ribokinase family)
MINVTPDGQRTMCTFLGASTELTADDVDPKSSRGPRSSTSKAICSTPTSRAAPSPRPPAWPTAPAAADGHHPVGRFVVERHRAALMGFIDTQCDIVFANEVEVKALFQTDDFDAAAKALAGKVKRSPPSPAASTARWCSPGGERHEVPAYAVEKVVDTTGAGDQYAAGFLFGLARERSLETAASSAPWRRPR